MYYDLTRGSISKSLFFFALPMMAGNLLQQFYNIADTLIVGRVLGKNALAAVGSVYTLMTFLTSVFLGLSMGAGALFSIYLGKKKMENLRSAVYHAFLLIMIVTILLNGVVYLFLNPILAFLRVPAEVWNPMKDYLLIIFGGLIATSLYNFFACMLRALGNSAVPLYFLAVSAIINIILDLLFIIGFHWGIRGAAAATITAQYISAIGITIYVLCRCQNVVTGWGHIPWNRRILKEILNLSTLTCLQQSVMNFGILMVQGLVNSFGATIMAAFAAAVKIDTFAYLPVQDFGNAFSTFTAQNYGAGNHSRIRAGIRQAFLIAAPLMKIFIAPSEHAVIAAGVQYLRIEGSFYCGIGCLFLLYGYYRAINQAEMSVVLTVISLGLRVLLAYILSGVIGVTGIWIAIPIGWLLADAVGLLYMKKTLN